MSARVPSDGAQLGLENPNPPPVKRIVETPRRSDAVRRRSLK